MKPELINFLKLNFIMGIFELNTLYIKQKNFKLNKLLNKLRYKIFDSIVLNTTPLYKIYKNLTLNIKIFNKFKVIFLFRIRKYKKNLETNKENLKDHFL